MKKLIIALLVLSFALTGVSLAADGICDGTGCTNPDCPICDGCDGTGPHGPNSPKK